MPRLTAKLSNGTTDGFLEPGKGEGPEFEKAAALRAILANAHVVLRPLHRRSPDAELRSYFVADLPPATSRAQIERLAGELAEVTESVYMKPEEAIPTLRATGSPQRPNLPRFPASKRTGGPAATPVRLPHPVECGGKRLIFAPRNTS